MSGEALKREAGQFAEKSAASAMETLAALGSAQEAAQQLRRTAMDAKKEAMKTPVGGDALREGAEALAEKNVGGRPSKFTPEVANAIFEFSKLGYTDAEMAKALGIAESTLNNWKLDRPDYFEQLKGAKAIANHEVTRSLFEKATGQVRIPAVKIMQYEGMEVIVPYVERFAPDTEAQKFWLKNREPDKWREKVEMDVKGDFAERLVRARERVKKRKK